MAEGAAVAAPRRYAGIPAETEAIPLNMKNLASKIKPPCPKCPYKLGLVHTLVNPCPQCKANGYRMFEEFQRKATEQK